MAKRVDANTTEYFARIGFTPRFTIAIQAMIRFLRDVGLFCLINLTILAYLYAIYDVRNDYLASINDKLSRLAASYDSVAPRILFVGGSSVAWGTHSSIVKEKLELEPTNMATHAAMGLGVRIEEARQLTRQGDIVVFSAEWSVLGDAPWNRKMTEVLLACPQAAQFMSFRDLKLAMDGLLPAMRMPFVAVVEDAKANGLRALTHASAQARRQHHLRHSFNEFGDYEGHYERDVIGIEGMIVRKPKLEEIIESVDRLNQLYDELEQRGVHMFYFIPLIPESRYEQEKPTFDEFVETIANGLRCPILNPNEFTYPDDAFFDSCYHMRKETGVDRTNLIIDKLRPLLDR